MENEWKDAATLVGELANENYDLKSEIEALKDRNRKLEAVVLEAQDFVDSCAYEPEGVWPMELEEALKALEGTEK